MSADDVVVLGSGYAGTGAVRRLQAELGDDADLTWISDVDYHLVLHEAHRCVRDPSVKGKITVPVSSIADPGTRFVESEVTGIDAGDRVVALADGGTVDFDYLLVGFGSRTAFFGIEGLAEHAHTLKSLDDALAIHDDVVDAARRADADEPARVVVGGAGLSGIQTAGEVAELRDRRDLPVAVTLVEGLDSVLPNSDPTLQGRLRTLLDEAGVDVLTGEFVTEVGDEVVHVGNETQLPYDVLVWTGGITGRAAAEHADVATDERSHRFEATSTFRTSEDRVFAIGDAALVDQPGDEPAPPTAQAAWQAAEVAGANVARAMRGEPLAEWTYRDRGTLVSVGDEAIAHDVDYVPVDTFGGPVAEALKKGVAARWIAKVAGPVAAARAWPDM